MLKGIKQLIKSVFPHTHIHNRLVVSMYRSFETRRCIWECKCGHRKQEFNSHSYIYPHKTGSIDHKQFKDLLTSSPVKYDLEGQFYHKSFGLYGADFKNIT